MSNLFSDLIGEILAEEFRSHTYEPMVGDVVANDNPNCMHQGSVGVVISLQDLPSNSGRTASYECLNSGPAWREGEVLTKTLDQIVPAVSSDLAYHVSEGLTITNSIYRPGSESFLSLVREVRDLTVKGLYKPTQLEAYYLFATDLGEYGMYEGREVPLDWPMPAEDLFEAEYRGKKVKLNEPQRSSGPKKYQVYTKNKKGNVIKVPFGDEKGGLSAKLDDKDARDNFVSRHNCDSEAKKDKTKPGYWSCRLPRYWENLGLKKNSFRFW